MVHSELTPAPLGQILLWLIGQRRRFRVTGDSMRPGLKPNDTVLVNCHAYKTTSPIAGDVVVAMHPYKSTHVVKRVDHLDEDGRVFIVGDNPGESTDSRSFGALREEQIIGKVVSTFP